MTKQYTNSTLSSTQTTSTLQLMDDIQNTGGIVIIDVSYDINDLIDVKECFEAEEPRKKVHHPQQNKSITKPVKKRNGKY